jgi:hypothetical protein
VPTLKSPIPAADPAGTLTYLPATDLVIAAEPSSLVQYAASALR